MDDKTYHLKRKHGAEASRRRGKGLVGDVLDKDEGDAAVLETLNRTFRQAQNVLDRNRVLIQQVNENHQSLIPENMAKNVALIQELNGNMNKIASIYSDLNTNFPSLVHERNKAKKDQRGEQR